MHMHLPSRSLLLVLLLAAGCAPRGAARGAEPLVDPAATAARLASGSLPDTLLHVTFGWTYADADARLRGRGVARVDAPTRLRLDLFGPQGETYLAAAMVGEELRAPAAARVDLPSPALLWAALGVLHLPAGAAVVEGWRTGGVISLRVEGGGDSYHYRADEETGRLLEVSRLYRGRPLESVLVAWDAGSHPSGARYRHQAEFRELNLDIEALRAAAPFPESIWYPDGR